MTVENPIHEGETVVAPKITLGDIWAWEARGLAQQAQRLKSDTARKAATYLAAVMAFAASCDAANAAIPIEGETSRPKSTPTEQVIPPTETPIPTSTPEPTPTATPTEAPTPEPMPTVIPEFVNREIGGIEGEPFTVKRGGEEQAGWKYKMPSGETIFQIGYIDMLPDGSLADPDLKNEVVYYVGPDGKRSNEVFLTLQTFPKDNADLANHPNALPFVQTKPIGTSYPEGAIIFMDGKFTAAFASPFEELQEGEEKVVFNGQKGVYEFQDKDGNVLREKQVFSTELKSISVENAQFVEWSPEEIEKAVIEAAERAERRIQAGEDNVAVNHTMPVLTEEIKFPVPLELKPGQELIATIPERGKGHPQTFPYMILLDHRDGGEIIFKSPMGGRVSYVDQDDDWTIFTIAREILGTTYEFSIVTLTGTEILAEVGDTVEVGESVLKLAERKNVNRFHNALLLDVGIAMFDFQRDPLADNYARPTFTLENFLTDNQGNFVTFPKENQSNLP